ncbi:hypothetical protein SAMN04515671_3383 [Nakamurella panacisegetis]|uniref:Uncharacterized protein n=1 Tax=Nakamurella panacisegetis TaxID=1090615 RepID=A0A1H0R5B7_9ACTN|nr:hypothetical protein SAMN04515671_3383 [Nakamurella panacisegetis]
MPDTDDLRLLAEIINNGAIGLPQAAWNARMSQSEAAARFVTMAERGMPLRLVAEGDRQLLWRIAQAGPATGGFPLPDQTGAAPGGPASGAVPAAPLPPSVAAPAPYPSAAPVGGPLPDQAPPVAYPPPSSPPSSVPGPPLPPPTPVESQPVQQLPVPLPPMPPAPVIGLPPASAVPPHEQAIAGAVPLGQPPFGTPPTGPASAEPADAGPAPTPEPSGETPDEAAPPAPPENGTDQAAEPDRAMPEQSAAPATPDVPVVASAAVETSTWGVPGSSSWARVGDTSSAAESSPDLTQAYPPPSRFDEQDEASEGPGSNPAGSPVVTPLPPLFPPSVLADFTPPEPHDTQSRHAVPGSIGAVEPEPVAAQPVPAATPAPQPPPGSSPTRRTMISGQPTQNVAGLFGEHLAVSLQQIIDPADQILVQAGYRLEPGERALMVQTTVANQGQIDYESLPDLYLMLKSSTGAILQKAAMGVAPYPAHRVGVPAGTHASGWTVFLVPADTEVTEVRWSVRPDLANRTVVWGFGPA